MKYLVSMILVNEFVLCLPVFIIWIIVILVFTVFNGDNHLYIKKNEEFKKGMNNQD